MANKLAGQAPAKIADPRPLAAALRAVVGPLLPKGAAEVDGGDDGLQAAR